MLGAQAQKTGAEQQPEPIIRRRDIDWNRYNQARDAGLSELSARILAARAYSSKMEGEPEKQAKPALSDLDDPATLPDIEVAAARITTAILSEEVIAIETDFDTDGVTSHAVIHRCLKELFGVPGERLQSYIGHRIKEGYGLSWPLAHRIHENAADLVVTADNGSADHERILWLSDNGVDTVVTDHHEIPSWGIPDSAFAVVNPTRESSRYPDPLIAGCMVAFLLMTRVRGHLNDLGYFEGRPPSMTSLLGFVAVGTVADCVSMARSHNNRAAVSRGLKEINTSTRPCWQITRHYLAKGPNGITQQEIAFGLGPRINARGRLSDARVGVDFLLSETLEEANRLWQVLDQENEQRKSIETDLKDQAMKQASEHFGDGRSGLALWLSDGHSGVHGIVASRVVEKYGLPTVCLSPVHTDPSRVTGSARGVPGFSVKKAFDWIHEASPKILEKFGGHEGAGGLTISVENRERLQLLWDEAVCAQAALGVMEMGPVIWTDGENSAPSLEDVQRIHLEVEPFGREFDEPVFEGEFTVIAAKTRGDGRHIALTLSHNGNRYQAIWFSAKEPDDVWGPQPMPVTPGQQCHIAYAMENNHFNGVDRLQLRVIHCTAR